MEGGHSKRGSREDPCEDDTGAELLQSGAGELKQNQASMANTISNMKMTNPIKGLVSKRRKRFTADGFDLDLTCKLFYKNQIYFHQLFYLKLNNICMY